MRKRGARSSTSIHEDSDLRARIDLVKCERNFIAKIRRNDVEYAAALSYLGLVVYAFLTKTTERMLGLFLILSAMVILLYVRSDREDIEREFNDCLNALKEKS